jgi:lycopene beta-cyclase
VFERFYRLPTTTVERFYAMDITMADRVRLLVGRPPPGISLRAALGRVFQ